MSKKVIIFDFDGVIVDSFHAALRINQMSKPTLTEDRYRKMFDGNIHGAVYTDKVVREVNYQEEYAKQVESLHIDENIKKNIKSLSKQFQLFIISSTITQNIQDYLQKHDLLDSFTEILGHDVEKNKVKKFEMLF